MVVAAATRAGSAVAGILSQVWADDEPEAAGDGDHPDERVLRRVELEAAVGAGAVRQRFDQGHDAARRPGPW